LDRWDLTIENKKGKVKQVKSFFNYLGVGVDAQAALQVHMVGCSIFVRGIWLPMLRLPND
jgi:hypothetical protein